MMKDREDLMSCLSWVSCRYVITIYDIMKFFAERSKSWRVNLSQNSWVHITLATKIKKRICSIFKLRAGASKTSHVGPVPGKFRQIFSLAQFQPYSKLIIDFREGFKKKKLEFSNFVGDPLSPLKLENIHFLKLRAGAPTSRFCMSLCRSVKKMSKTVKKVSKHVEKELKHVI